MPSALVRLPLAMLLIAMLAACAHAPPYAPVATTAEIIVVRRGWHIDVGFAAAQLGRPLAFLRSQVPSARYVFVGFGDERYVRSAHHRLPALLAAVWPGRGVMLVTTVANEPAEAFGDSQVRRISLSNTQWLALEGYVSGSFATRPGDMAPLKSGPYAGSWYYASAMRYSGLHTCNTWAAEALRSAGLPVRTRGVLLAGQLWPQVRPLERAGAH